MVAKKAKKSKQVKKPLSESLEKILRESQEKHMEKILNMEKKDLEILELEDKQRRLTNWGTDMVLLTTDVMRESTNKSNRSYILGIVTGASLATLAWVVSNLFFK